MRKSLYDIDENIKSTLPAKNADNDLGHELEYTHQLITKVSEDEVIINYPKVKERLNMLKESIEDIADHYTTSTNDSDARVGHKSADDSFFGYKTHIAMSDERIITAATVTSGEKGDGPQLPQLVDESRKNGIEVEFVIGDAAYSGDTNLKKASEEDFKIVAKLNPSVSQGFRKESDKFDFNKDAGMYICPAGHLATRKAKQGKKGDQTNQTTTYYFDVEKCKFCSKREGCYKDGAKSKTYSISIKTDEQTAQMEFQESQQFKDKAKHRYKIEAKNAELKHSYGYDRAQSYGLECMQMQGALAIFTANIKRILKLI